VEVPRPARAVNPAAKLKDSANTEVAQLSFQRKAVQDFHSRQAVKNNPAPSTVANPPAPSVNVESTPHKKRTLSSINGSDVEDEIIDQPVPRMSCFHNNYILAYSAFFSQKEACHGNRIGDIAGEEQGHNISNSWNS
jgi:hypothetical protein